MNHVIDCEAYEDYCDYILLVGARSWLLHASQSIVAMFIIKLTIIICMHVWTRMTKPITSPLAHACRAIDIEMV